jgi:ATPase, P-type (transporting), HAD superfamily, subfamily IC
MTSVSLAVAAIPEGLPAIVTIMLSLGVQRMAKKNAIIRYLPAVETLGSATVICSDKTGTLTQNKMTVTDISSYSDKEEPGNDFSKFLLTLATQCNDSLLHIEKKKLSATGEPTENALILAAQEFGINKSKLDLTYPRIYEIPFDSNRKRMTTVHKMDSSFQSITKGAPDILLPLCSHIYNNGKVEPMQEKYRILINKQNLRMTEQALRVIAVAYKELPSNFSGSHVRNSSELEHNLIFVGLIGMIDPPRPEVRDAVLICKRAGIKPVMITGDHVMTACAIARELGILYHENQAITGAELSKMDDEVLKERIPYYTVFARVSPEHKVRIVKAFQSNKEVVAMTGDGVNDAPALKAADIGCAMGITGTDVAKNAADMILTDDNFATIVSAVKEGRGIYDNIRKAIHFLLSSNIGEILTIFTAILFGYSSPLKAVQLLWVNLVTDSLPAISLGMEPADKNIMKKKPISPTKGMFADGLVLKIIFEGMLIGFLALSAYIIGSRFYTDSSQILGTTMCFAVLSLSQLFHSFNMRSEHSIFQLGLFSNFRLVLSFIVCAFLQIFVISYAPLATVFKIVPLNRSQWIVVFILSFMPIVVVELQKFVNKH